MKIVFMNDRDKIILQDGKFTAIQYLEEFQYTYKSGQGMKTSTQCYNFENLSEKILDTIQNIKNSNLSNDPIIYIDV